MTTYTYDANGQPLTLTDNSSHTTSETYDSLGRTTTVTRPDNSQTTTTYDAAGETLTVSNSAGTTTTTYDPLGRVLTQVNANGSGTMQTTVASTYDADGNVVQKQTAAANNSTTTVMATYDPLDRQISMTDGNRSYTYDANGNVLTMQVQNSGSNVVGATYGYDGDNRVTSMTTTVGPSSTQLHSYSFTYDGDGNIHTTSTDGNTATYSYDANNQLTQVQDSGGTTSYSYDANYNRTSMTTSGGTTTYTYDSSADVELTQKMDPSGNVTTYQYDSNGNLKTETYDPSSSDQITTLTYDQSNRLTGVGLPNGTTVSYTYDANDNQTSTTVTTGGSSPTTTVVNNIYVGGKLTQQTDGNGNLLATFTYNTAGEPVSVQVGSDLSSAPRYYYVYNGRGDVVALTDASGNVAANYSYDPFGILLSSSENFPNGWTNPLRYDGKDGVLFNAETNLYWMSSRVYDPTLGRFLSRDLLGRAPLFFVTQPYTYAGNNPVTNVDPSGNLVMPMLGSGGYSKEQWEQDMTTWAESKKAQNPARDYHLGTYISPNVVNSTGRDVNLTVIAAAITTALAQDNDGGYAPYFTPGNTVLNPWGYGVVNIYTKDTHKLVTSLFAPFAIPGGGSKGAADHTERAVLTLLIGEANAWSETVTSGLYEFDFNVVTGLSTCDTCARGGARTTFIDQVKNGMTKSSVWNTFQINMDYISPFYTPGSPSRDSDYNVTSPANDQMSYLYNGYASGLQVVAKDPSELACAVDCE